MACWAASCCRTPRPARAAGSRPRKKTRPIQVTMTRLKTYPRAGEASWWKPFEVGVVGLVRDDPIVQQMTHFGAVVRGEAPPLVSARDGLANLRVTEAIARAAASGHTVELL